MPRPRKAAHIYRRPGRNGWYAYVDRDNRDISLETEDETEAHRKLGELMQRRRDVPGRLEKGDVALSKVFAECRDRAKINNTIKTAYSLHCNLARTLEWLTFRGIVGASEVTKSLVETYKSDRSLGWEGHDPVGDATINRELTSWKRAMFQAHEDHGIADLSPYFVKMKVPQIESHRPGLSSDTLDKFFTAMATLDARYLHLCRVALGSGIRPDEARHLDLTNLQKQSIKIFSKAPGTCTCHPKGWTTKSFRNREIPASAATLEAAKAFVAAKKGMALDDKGIWKRIAEACDRAEIERFSLYDLRRAWGSHLLQADFKLALISKWYGHKDLQTTMRYLRIVDHEMPDPETLPW